MTRKQCMDILFITIQLSSDATLIGRWGTSQYGVSPFTLEFHQPWESTRERNIPSSNSKRICAPPFAKGSFEQGYKAAASLCCHCFETMLSSRQVLEVRPGENNPSKWCTPLSEYVFDSFVACGGDVVHQVFGEGSAFSPLLFGKFFDPADAFPLWDFESEVLLRSIKSSVDWSETGAEYILRAELPGAAKNNFQICVENGKVIEISGKWREKESDSKDWKTGLWWEHGYVRRLELPEDANWRKAEACVNDDIFLEIRVPKNESKCNVPEAN